MIGTGLDVGLFGGSFNPPHRGHLALARAARDQLGLTQVRWLPAGCDPELFKGVYLGSNVRLAQDSSRCWVILFPDEWAVNYFQEKNPDIQLLKYETRFDTGYLILDRVSIFGFLLLTASTIYFKIKSRKLALIAGSSS